MVYKIVISSRGNLRHLSSPLIVLGRVYAFFMILNPCPAELLQLYFSSFEAGIATAISSFKWRKIWLFMKNRHV